MIKVWRTLAMLYEIYEIAINCIQTLLIVVDQFNDLPYYKTLLQQTVVASDHE